MKEPVTLTHLAVIESEPLLRAAWEKLVRSFASCWVAGSYSSYDDFFIRSNGYPFDVFLLRVEDAWAINWTDLRNIRSHKPDAGIVVMLGRGAARFAPVAMENGAHGIVSVSADPRELQEAIFSAAGKRQYLCQHASDVCRAMLEQDKNNRRDQLSSREADVLALTARGLRLKEIGEQLGVNIKTAHSYRIRAMQKLGLQNTAQVIRYAMENASHETPETYRPSELSDLSPDEED